LWRANTAAMRVNKILQIPAVAVSPAFLVRLIRPARTGDWPYTDRRA
jgi:hypothetical protein